MQTIQVNGNDYKLRDLSRNGPKDWRRAMALVETVRAVPKLNADSDPADFVRLEDAAAAVIRFMVPGVTPDAIASLTSDARMRVLQTALREINDFARSLHIVQPTRLHA